MSKISTHHTTFGAIEVLRFPLIILVVFVHVIPPLIHPVRLNWSAGDIFTLMSELISHNIGRTAVPCFFLFSGYFFFLKISFFSVHLYAEQLGKRWSTLAIPYFLWNIVFVLVVLVKNFIFIRLGLPVDDMYADVKQSSYIDILWGRPFLFPFWYLRDLICMVILSPIFYLLFKYAKGFGLLFLTIIYLMVWESRIPGLSTTAFLFFGMGAYMGIYKRDLLVYNFGHKCLIFMGAIFFLGIAAYFNATSYYEYFMRIFVIFGVLSWLNIGKYLTRYPNIGPYLINVSSSVFFIYAVHEIYIINWLKGAWTKLPLLDHGWGRLIAYFIVPIVCVIICLCLYKLMKTLFPKALSVMLGGRKLLSKN